MCTKIKFLTLSVILLLTSYSLHASDGPGKKSKKQSSGLVQDKWYNGFKIYMLKNFYTIKAPDREGYGIFNLNYLTDSTYLLYQLSYHRNYNFIVKGSIAFGLEKQWKIKDKFNIYAGLSINSVQFDFSSSYTINDTLLISKNYFKQSTGFNTVLESYNTPKTVVFDDGNRDDLVIESLPHFSIVSLSFRTGVKYNLSRNLNIESGLVFSPVTKVQEFRDAHVKDNPSLNVPYITYASRLVNLYHLQADMGVCYRFAQNFELGLHYQLTLNNFTNPEARYVVNYSNVYKTRASYWGISLGLRI